MSFEHGSGHEHTSGHHKRQNIWVDVDTDNENLNENDIKDKNNNTAKVVKSGNSYVDIRINNRAVSAAEDVEEHERRSHKHRRRTSGKKRTCGKRRTSGRKSHRHTGFDF
ncbi:hypothetical protein JOD45_001314 [Scopulibacillus daqui]|uniref:Uncharacterized protein n=1 Tax=Scopulibacillus daqui TaxID=1469162 RepID=A0ABS2PYG4_9BACL|nr:hypothetical protein [Scopulibacillus daqui]MBM7645103.1 hypothetical protein [Scopulibacillus daqui]